MPEHNPLHNTPIRHNVLSITQTSLRSRLVISTDSNWRNSEIKKCDKNENNEGAHQLHLLADQKKTSSRIEKQNEVCDWENKMWEPCSSMEKDGRGSDQSSTCEEDMDSLSSENMEMSVIREQKHSTPQIIKISNLTRAVSSTPNPVTYDNSKLARSVFTQTIFTLSSREEYDLSGDLQSYCIEVSEERNSLVPSSSQNLGLKSNTDSTSPLRIACSSKSIRFDSTPVQSKTSSRKLSLRSKTIICSAIEKSKDVPKGLTRHKSMEEKRLFSNTFSLMPHLKTPPSQIKKILHNPFEIDLPERLSKTLFSPDVFENVISPSQDSEDLRWTIEDISSINPVPIEEDFVFPSDEEDPEIESKVQEEIDRYFSETHYVLSPDDIPATNSSLLGNRSIHTGAVVSTPRKVKYKISKETRNSSSQTVLSLCGLLPKETEEYLKVYFKFFETDESSLNVSNLRRKLFFHSEDEPPSPVRFDIYSSPVTKDKWKTETSPFTTVSKERHFTPLGRHQELSSPEISPVVSNSPTLKMKNDSMISCKKTLELDFANMGNPKGQVVNSTAIATSDVDSCSLPSSQDTGYNTEDSYHLHFSTPTRNVQ